MLDEIYTIRKSKTVVFLAKVRLLKASLQGILVGGTCTIDKSKTVFFYVNGYMEFLQTAEIQYSWSKCISGCIYDFYNFLWLILALVNDS